MKIYSIFSSINGEANCRGQGSWATFIRLAGCSLGCSYCDTKYAQNEEDGSDLTVTMISKMIQDFRIPYVTITGGEPFEQREELLHLIIKLKTRGIHITVETNGYYGLPSRMDYGVDCYVLDYKLPGAKVGDAFSQGNLPHLTHHDWIKFVISDMEDYEEAKKQQRLIYQRNGQIKFAFSPVLDKVSPNDLYNWMLEDNIWNVQLSLQLHKIVKLSEPR